MKQSNSSAVPLVSVIIPAFNCEKYIFQALESILNQDYRNLQILVSDDCSTDRTKSIIDSYTDPRIKVFHNDKNEGNLTTTNKLFEKATGTFITFQDADDWSHTKRIGEQVELLQNNPSIDICSTGYARVKENGEHLFNVVPVDSHDEIVQEIQFNRHPKLCYGSIMVNRTCVQNIRCIYRLYFKGIGGADIDFLYRLLDKYTIKNSHDIRYYYRTSLQSITNKVDLYNHRTLSIGPKLSYILRQQREENGIDMLQQNEFVQLDKIKNDLLNDFDPHYSFTLVATRWASFQEFSRLVALTKQYIVLQPFSLLAYINISIAFVRFFLGEDRYRNVSSRLTLVKKIYNKLANNVNISPA